MRIAIPKEVSPGERRVAATPKTVEKLRARGFEVVVEADAGSAAGYPDAAYVAAGATIEADADAVWRAADVIFKVEPPTTRPDGVDEATLPREGAVLVSFVYPARDAELLARLAAAGVTTIAMDAVPRVTRAQRFDALSSMANVAGYRAVIEAANHYGSFFAGQFTAAGKVSPAKVLVIGAGVAGLAAIAAAHGLGAIVRAFDTRAAVKDEVKSLGAEFLELDYEEEGEGTGGYAKVMSQAFIDAEMALFREQASEVDVVITTALVPGKKAPTLWDADMVARMKPGSVVVDLAAGQGGNCALSRPGEVVDQGGVKIIGFTDMPSRMAKTASQLYATNLLHLLTELGDAASFRVDMDDDVVRASVVSHEGAVTWPPPVAPEPTPPKKAAPPPPAKSVGPASAAAKRPSRALRNLAIVGIPVAALWLWLKLGVAPAVADPALAELIQHMTVFVLACFVGWQVIWNVSPALHTPLMSVTNAISGIIIVGGVLEGAHSAELDAATLLGLGAVLLATINIAGGFLVTQRMLRMFRKG